MYVFYVCMCVCHLRVWGLQRSEEGYGYELGSSVKAKSALNLWVPLPCLEDFVGQIIWSRNTLKHGLSHSGGTYIKRCGGRKLCFSPACPFSCWQVHPFCGCSIPTSLGFQHSLKTSSSPGSSRALVLDWDLRDIQSCGLGTWPLDSCFSSVRQSLLDCLNYILQANLVNPL